MRSGVFSYRHAPPAPPRPPPPRGIGETSKIALIFSGIAEIAVLGFAFDGLLRLADPTVRRWKGHEP